MSNTECYYIEEISISDRYGSDAKRPNSSFLDAKPQLPPIEAKCVSLRNQLDSMKYDREQDLVSMTVPSINTSKMEKVLPVKEEGMLKSKKKAPKTTVSDTYVQNATAIYVGTRKIPATNNLQRKSYKSKSVKMSDERHRKHLEIKACLSKGEFRKTRKMKCISSKSTLGGRTSYSVDGYRTFRNPFQHWNSDIVELYHNNAIKTLTESASDNSLSNRDKRRKSKGFSIATRRLFNKHTLPPAYSKAYNAVHQVDLQKKQSIQQARTLLGSQIETVPVRDQPSKSQQFIQRSQYRFPTQSVDVPIVDQMKFETPASYIQQNILAPIDEKTATSYTKSNNFAYSRPSSRSRQEYHYLLPTISSRLKQVTRNYFHQFNIRSIPFVTARSTTPSHNLGLNIQQVLNIMKTHQPISGISPTLAHNMGIVAGSSFSKGTDETINGILSRMSSKQSCCYNRRPVCPLLRQVESELADVPEHPCEDDIAEQPNDFDFKQRIATEWDQANPRACKQMKCTCQVKKGVNYNKVFNQYLDHQVQSTQSTNSQLYPVKQPRNFKSAFSMQTSINPSQYNIPPVENQLNFHYQLAGKVRGLRDVLANLHDDFQKLNARYDALSEKVQNVNDPKTMLQLEQMEKDLNAKEEEISVVISLYKEVLALKEQVRTLKEQTSVLSMATSHKTRVFEPNISLRLTKVLRQIQKFQGMLRKGE